MKSINCRGELLFFDTPKVMGILNVTPDSFFAQSRVQGTEILAKAEQMLALGATFVDIGGYSSRPNAAEVSAEEELQRVVPVVEALVKHFPEIRISVDTFRAEVARQSLEAGACMSLLTTKSPISLCICGVPHRPCSPIRSIKTLPRIFFTISLR